MGNTWRHRELFEKPCKQEVEGDTRQLLEVMDMSVTLTGDGNMSVHTSKPAKIHALIMCNFFVYQLYLNKAEKANNRKQ